MRSPRPHAPPRQPDPFGCYLGKRVHIGSRPHVVEGYREDAGSLLFRLRDVCSDEARQLTVLELLQLEDSQRPR